jgi:hypothetical protein
VEAATANRSVVKSLLVTLAVCVQTATMAYWPVVKSLLATSAVRVQTATMAH